MVQWILTGIIVAAAAVAVIIYIRRIHKDPCSGCSLADTCKKKDCKR